MDGRLRDLPAGRPPGAVHDRDGRLVPVASCGDNGPVDDRLETDEHPVAYGLVALVGVAVVVGLILGLVALGGASVMGLGGETTTSTAGAEASMYLPRPEQTKADNGPEITLAPGEETTSSEPDEEGQEEKKDKKPKKAISLSAGQLAVAPMEQIDLTGIYPGGEGAILKVQRFENGSWVDFYSVTATVSDQTFSTYVQTGQPGEHRFRVVDSATGKPSNEIRVTVG